MISSERRTDSRPEIRHDSGRSPVNVFITIFISHQKSIAHTKKKAEKREAPPMDQGPVWTTASPPVALLLALWGVQIALVNIFDRLLRGLALRRKSQQTERVTHNNFRSASHSHKYFNGCFSCSAHCTRTVHSGAGEREGAVASPLVRHQMHVVYLGVRISHARLAAETKRQNQADKRLHWEKFQSMKSLKIIKQFQLIKNKI